MRGGASQLSTARPARLDGRGRLELTRDTFDLAELARDVCDRFAETFARAGCRLTLKAAQPVVGKWDRAHLDQVLTNLLPNAAKFGAGKSAAVSVERTDALARVEVHDEGIGIPEDKIPLIFRRFERAAPARSYGGLGLGLFIVHAIVEAHGGTVHVDSRAGASTTLTVELPLREQPT